MKNYVLIVAILASLPILGQKINMDEFSGLKPRSIGPAGTSGRVTAIDAVHENPDIIYIGTASGGLWKSEGGGTKWEPIFDKQDAASIGALAIDQSNPDIIWVGTGEGNPRNSMTSGNGVYKSIDGGKTWTHMGLEKTRNIHRIIVHANNPNTVFVAAVGDAWADNEERGVFRTIDGGKTWEKVLYVNPRTGAEDFIVDPSNPNKMFVNMWEHRRWPWFFKSGGPGSGLYVTLDGGDTWTKRTEKNGLPEGDLGKIGLTISRSNPKIVYALVESKKNGLYRSDDGGFQWKLMASKDIGDRPFYYADIAVDPENENRLYNVFSNVKVSIDGGKTFKTLLGWDNIHGDHHFWWIHPEDGSMIINGNDGGVAISRDRGKTWRFVENLPVAQFYHIRTDNEIPYNVMGGMQDNGTWRGPAYSWRKGGIRNGYWEEIGFGDGFDVLFDLDDATKGFVMWQQGNLQRVDFINGTQQKIRPVHPEAEFLRFNWNAGIARDPFDPNIIYYGSQYVHKTSNKGNTWEIVSPDLTTNDVSKQNQSKSGGLTYDVTGAENYTTILSIEPSTVQQGVIWVGTDDGNIQLTTDGGKTWENKVSKIKNFPAGAWIPQIRASRKNAGEAFVVVNDYRRGNWTPYLYHTTDFGKTWEDLAANKSIHGYSLSFIQDPAEEKLFYLGTEFGLYVSIDAGSNWTKWTNGYPTVSTMDMDLQERERDLVIGTFGRSAWVFDDVQPLREIAQNQDILNKKIHVFDVRDAYLANIRQATGTRFHGDAIFRGEDRKYGALVNFSVNEVVKTNPEAKKDSVKVEILDQSGNVIRNLKIPAVKGVNRFFWGLTRTGVRQPTAPRKAGAPEPSGPFVLPGEYIVRVYNGDDFAESSVSVHADPRIEVSMDDLKAADKDVKRYLDAVRLTTEGMDRIREAKQTIKSVQSKVKFKDEETVKAFKEKAKALNTELDSLTMHVMPIKSIQGLYINPDQLSVKLATLSGYLNNPLSGPNSPFGTPHPIHFAPNPNYEPLMKDIEADLDTFINELNAFFGGTWKTFQEEVETQKIGLFGEYPALKMN